MKVNFKILLFLLSTTVANLKISHAQTYTNIPDVNFEKRLISAGVDMDGVNGQVLKSRVTSVKSIDLSNAGISNLTGIKDFTALESMVCFGNQLTSLDVSQNTRLKYLDCHSNLLTTLNLTTNTALYYLDCSANKISSLNLNVNTELTDLYCHNNLLTTINVSTLTSLQYFYCYGNQLSKINVKNSTRLQRFFCYNNKIDSVDLRTNTAIKIFYGQNNQGARAVCVANIAAATANPDFIKDRSAVWCGEAGNQLPTVTVSATPTTATAPATISLSATAADADGSISKVEFYNGTTLLNSDATAPYSFSWANVTAGTYSITAKAYDNVNASKTSTAVTVTVSAPVNQLPTVTVSATPTTATAPATISLSATAADADGSISKVEFYNGTVLLNSDATAPHSFSWSNVAAGTYSITAKAYDNVNASTTSTAVTVTVTNVATPTDITNLMVATVTCTSVKLTWSDVSGETQYRVRRKLANAATFTTIADIPANTTSYTDNTVSSNTNYVYMVRPLINGTAVTISNTPTIIVPACPIVTSLKEASEIETDVLVEPNPFEEEFTFQLPESFIPEEAYLINTSGVYTKVNIQALGESKYKINTANMVSGWYYLKLNGVNGQKVIPILKQK
jgi:hypothetical protein